MGILVEKGTLPSGIEVSNVFMTFRGEIIYVCKACRPKYIINSIYRVYTPSLSTSSMGSNESRIVDIKVPIQVQTNDISRGVYEYLYEELKRQYPLNKNMF